MYCVYNEHVDGEWARFDRYAEMLVSVFHDAMRTTTGEAQELAKVQMLAAQYGYSYSRAMRPFFVVRNGSITITARVKALLHHSNMREFCDKCIRWDNDYRALLREIQYNLSWTVCLRTYHSNLISATSSVAS